MSFYFYQISVKTNVANLFIPIVKKPKNAWFVTKGTWADIPVTQITNIKWAVAEKIQKGGIEDIIFPKPPRNFSFFTLRLEIPDKTKFNPCIFHNIVLEPLEIPRPKTKTPGNSALLFLGHPWKFHFVFNWPLKIPHAISLIYTWEFHILKLPPPAPCLDFFCFFWKAHLQIFDLLSQCKINIWA